MSVAFDQNRKIGRDKCSVNWLSWARTTMLMMMCMLHSVRKAAYLQQTIRFRSHPYLASQRMLFTPGPYCH